MLSGERQKTAVMQVVKGMDVGETENVMDTDFLKKDVEDIVEAEDIVDMGFLKKDVEDTNVAEDIVNMNFMEKEGGTPTGRRTS